MSQNAATLQNLVDAWAAQGEVKPGHQLAQFLGGLAPATVRSYRVAILRFWQWFDASRRRVILPREVTQAIALEFVEYLNRPHLVDSYVLWHSGRDLDARVLTFVQDRKGASHVEILRGFPSQRDQVRAVLRALVRERRLRRLPTLADIRDGRTSIVAPEGMKIEQAGIAFGVPLEAFHYEAYGAKRLALTTQELWLNHLDSLWLRWSLLSPWVNARRRIYDELRARQERARAGVTSEVFEQILRTTEGSRLRDYRDRVALLLLGEIGLQSHDIEQLKWEDAVFDDDDARLYGHAPSTRLRAALTALHKELIQLDRKLYQSTGELREGRADSAAHVVAHMKWWGPNVGSTRTSGLSPSGLAMMVRRRVRLAGISRSEGLISPESLRLAAGKRT